MRVAFVSFVTARHRDTPATRRTDRVARGLADRGHDVHVLCAQWWTGTRDVWTVDGVTYHGVSVGLEARRSFLVRVPWVLWRVSPDLVHAAAEPPSQVVAASGGASLARSPLVVEWYDEGDPSGAGRLRRRAARTPDAVVTPSRLVRTGVRELGADAEGVDVIPDSVEMDRIRDTDPSGSADVVYARRLDEAANLESLLLGLAELRDRDWTATVVGDGPEREAYERQAADLRIDDRVTFAGERSLEERIATYRGAHAFVQTAQRCPFASNLLWALACGCVGIVEYHAGSSAHELVEGRTRGFRTTSEQELADAIVSAGDLERLDVDEDFASYDEPAVLEQYVERYRAVAEDYGLF